MLKPFEGCKRPVEGRRKAIESFFDCQFQGQKRTIYIRTTYRLLASLMQWYICFLSGRSGAEIKFTLHVALPKRPINQFKPVQKSKQQRAYCSNIYTVKKGLNIIRDDCGLPVSTYFSASKVFVLHLPYLNKIAKNYQAIL